jgi:hypothetical protein
VNSAKPDNQRSLLFAGLVGLAVLVVGLVTYFALAAGSDGGKDRPGTTTTTAPPAAKPRPVVAMVEHGEQHAMLAFRVMPNGQLTGLRDGEQATYTLVHFDGQGQPVKEVKHFGGRGWDTAFEFEGLYDGATLPARIVGEYLHFDDTFGVEEYDWKIIPSVGTFDATVNKYAERFNECSKLQDVDPCEGVA